MARFYTDRCHGPHGFHQHLLDEDSVHVKHGRLKQVERQQGTPIRTLMRDFNVSKATLYRYLSGLTPDHGSPPHQPLPYLHFLRGYAPPPHCPSHCAGFNAHALKRWK
jgi:hypothetical protein